ncbi:uncharacterized protein LOC122079177 [Macadamia integrifolia]|uniref:uncharacterized protein LOC122079177 n=1 Tax=Macadamia integrifolia TaxID=60698 RepID=UPI001C4FF077|nr:uncharacterized protein LOC122079177 [Macadamia integrifolia]
MGSLPSLSSPVSSSFLSFPFFFFFFLFVSQLSLGSVEENLYEFCAPHFHSNCGDQNIGYPFSIPPLEECGLGIIHCDEQDDSTPFVSYDDQGVNPNRFEVKSSIDYNDEQIGIHDRLFTDLIQRNNCIGLYNLTLPHFSGHLSFRLISPYNITFRICNNSDPHTYIPEHDNLGLSGIRRCGDHVLYFSTPSLFPYPSPPPPPPPPPPSGVPQSDCKVVEFPVDLEGVAYNLSRRLSLGFLLQWKIPQPCYYCKANDTLCLYEQNQDRYFCAPPYHDVQEAPALPPKGGEVVGKNKMAKWKINIIIGVVSGFGGILLSCLVFFLIYHQRGRKGAHYALFETRSSSPSLSRLSGSIASYPRYGVPVFTYEELEKATNNFNSNQELGDGGFGTVYYGKLQDGREVAVKRLYETNCKRVEQFVNEIGILARLRHKNLVTLYGCTSRHSRELLLVYEFINNGTVADHLHGDRAESGSLPWPTRMSIAIETAQALSYLHAADIIHRDVKTNNILLCKNFQVKVADFGLSRLFPTDVTHVSTAPQGTPGYVDPEYHQCYRLTEKSDVYSFGVVLIELISSKPAIDVTRPYREINLADLAINKIQNQAVHELVDPCLGYETDVAVKGMMTSVAALAFRCLQYERDLRPSMDEVLEVLKGIEGKETLNVGFNPESLDFGSVSAFLDSLFALNSRKPEEVGVTDGELAVLENSSAALVGIFALLDHSSSVLSTVINAGVGDDAERELCLVCVRLSGDEHDNSSGVDEEDDSASSESAGRNPNRRRLTRWRGTLIDFKKRRDLGKCPTALFRVINYIVQQVMGGSMNSTLPFNSFLVFAFPFFLLLHLPLLSARPDQFPDCSAQHHFCGKLNISYPFVNLTYSWPFSCGLELIRCIKGSTPVIYPSDQNDESTYELQSINYTTNTVLAHDRRFTRQWLSDDDKCNALFNNYTMPPIFRYLSAQVISHNHTLEVCKRRREAVDDSHGSVHPKDCTVEVIPDGAAGRPSSQPFPYDCKLVHLPADHVPSSKFQFAQLFTVGFRLRWSLPQRCHQCHKNGTVCVSYGQNNLNCCNPKGIWNQEKDDARNMTQKIGIGIFTGVAAGILFTSLIFFMFNKNRTKHNFGRVRSIFMKTDLEKGSTHFGVPIFSYAELEEATNNFSSVNELGDGGFATVYHGKLRDGRVVAIKRLYHNNKKHIQSFMNEIEILTHLRHQNLVTLYGCTSYRSRELLLVYEFIPNGTVADHLHGDRKQVGSLPWPVRMSIAMETASALSYLHASDIIHRDVKTSNILLDKQFHVKVADFGLCRLFPTDASHVSTAPQGTPGYVDPEYHRSYQLTEKSDVYSFGVVLIELISSKCAVDTTRCHDEINLANMAINKIQNGALQELVDPCLGFDLDCTRRIITLVAELAFRCLQYEKELRPSMDEVLKILRDTELDEERQVDNIEVMDILASYDVEMAKNSPPPLASPDSGSTD